MVISILPDCSKLAIFVVCGCPTTDYLTTLMMDKVAGWGVIISGIRGKVIPTFKNDVDVGKKQLLDMGGIELYIRYPHGAVDAMHFLSTPETPLNNKTVIFFPGMGEAYERFGIWGVAEESLVIQYQRAGFNVLLWNYPNTVESTGAPCLRHITEAATSIVLFLKHKFQVRERHILLHGHSMGGGICVHFASRRKENSTKLRFPRLSVCNDRSFSSLEKAVESHVQKRIPLIGKKTSAVVNSFLSVCKWKLDTLENWNLPESKGYYWLIHNIDDTMIPNECSLAFALREEGRDVDRIIELIPYNTCIWKKSQETAESPGGTIRDYSELHSTPCHERPLYPDEWAKHLRHLKCAFPH